jgi:diguanylate cyclase (GGDEF)-like protein
VLRTVAEIVQVNERLQHRLQQAEQKLHEQSQQIQNHMAEARTDPLTGLPNRRAFDDELARRLAEWKRKGALFCLLLVDLDHFKELNDRHGHPAGDQVLRQLAEVLLAVLREMDMAARIGGEEFAVLLPSTNLPDAMRVAQRLRAAVADAPLEIDPGQTIKLTISIGLTAVRPGDHPLLLLRRADQALYAAKRAGRDCGFYHDGQTCRPIPFCSPPDRSWSIPPEWPSAGEDQPWNISSQRPSTGEDRPIGLGHPGQSSCFPSEQDLPDQELSKVDHAVAACPGGEDPWSDPASFQSACEALRNQLTALSGNRPAPASPGLSE